MFFFPLSLLSVYSQITFCRSHAYGTRYTAVLGFELCSESDLLTTRQHSFPVFLRTKTLVYNRKLCVFCNVNLQKRNLELRGTEHHSIMYSGHVCSSLQKETLSLTSKVVCYSDILEMVIWNKGSQCLCSQKVQKCERP